MQNRVARVVLVLVALLVAGVAGYRVFQVDRRMTGARAEEAAAERDLVALSSTAAELRTAQVAAVAQGQATADWTARAQTLADDLAGRLEVVRQRLASPDAIRALGDAATSLAAVRKIDNGARSHLDRDQRLLASDLIFTDGLEASRALAAALDEAQPAERQMRERQYALLRRGGIYALAAGVAALLVALGLLAPLPAPDAGRAGLDVLAPDLSERRLGRSSRAMVVEALLDLDTGSGVVKHATKGGAAAAAPPGEAATPPPTAAPTATTPGPPAGEVPGAAAGQPLVSGVAVAEAPAAPDLDAAARLCTDLARVAEAQELPGLLHRAAALLDATGIIIWVQDVSAKELRPVIGHGFSPQAMARIPSIPWDADNATASAFRAGELRAVPADPPANGAVVAPLVTAFGPVGAMAAEVRPGRETDPGVRALAVILAAQIAMLVPAPQARAGA